jgi:hypothetical protein
VTLKPVDSSVASATGVPPASAIASGYVTQYGAGTSTSSPGSQSAAKALYTACLPPLVMRTLAASTTKPESRAVFAATADRSSGRPGVGVYLWLTGSDAAAMAASTMAWGVGKSGSPAVKFTTSRPAALRAFALASRDTVADGAMAAMRRDKRDMAAMLAQ